MIAPQRKGQAFLAHEGNSAAKAHELLETAQQKDHGQ